MISRWLAIGLALLICAITARAGLPGDGLLAIVGINAVILSMILRPGWWTFWLPLGFWEQRASDSHQADRLGPVIQLLGWIALFLMLGLSSRITP